MAVDTTTTADPLRRAPTYHVVQRALWTGDPHDRIYEVLTSLASTWAPRFVVIDSTGVGQGLASFLQAGLGTAEVIPYVFSQKSKSALGWGFLALVDSGRFKDHADGDGSAFLAAQSALQARFYRELSFTAYRIRSGPNKMMDWSVPDGTREPISGELVHDDLVISAALASVLDRRDFLSTGPSLLIPGVDPLEDMDRGF